MSREDQKTRTTEKVRAYARELGFDAVGIARADVSLDRDIEHYDAFVSAGMQGTMGWLARHRDVRARLDGEGVLPGAKSVVCLARRYAAGDGAGAGATSTIARYARGRDYHGFLRQRVRRVAAFIRTLGTPEQPAEARPICDDAPILERAWAARAGLGFVGKNGLLIVPGVGSMVLLGEVVTTLTLEPNEPMTERCGTCRRCLDACPTQAFVAPFVLDARRCISYLTIEQPGAVEPGLRAAVADHLFGCDDCQTVCPFNAGASARAPLWGEDGDPFAPFERWSSLDLAELLSLDEAGWTALSNGSPLKRAGRAGIARNAAIVLGNRGAREALPALQRAVAEHDDAVVRETAAWAIAQIDGVGRV
ncbi:MAG TPA: tRNA epoxyqueuosine(34) reductase QueG [Polyangiaceae bacterium]|nr:tRNA epoxyqueuosine(34) reductase QueG [Polyangiaceae bacterium]